MTIDEMRGLFVVHEFWNRVQDEDPFVSTLSRGLDGLFLPG